jgi:hypothetical protein
VQKNSQFLPLRLQTCLRGRARGAPAEWRECGSHAQGNVAENTVLSSFLSIGMSLRHFYILRREPLPKVTSRKNHDKINYEM